MTPEFKIKKEIILLAIADGTVPADIRLEDTDIEDVYDHYELCYTDNHHEYREGQVENDIFCQDSRHYESRSVASKMSDGSWVGWTYWYGGGKHSDPDSIPWMEESYDLNCVETQETITVRTFTKVDS